jgi:hypothetical protein
MRNCGLLAKMVPTEEFAFVQYRILSALLYFAAFVDLWSGLENETFDSSSGRERPKMIV